MLEVRDGWTGRLINSETLAELAEPGDEYSLTAEVTATVPPRWSGDWNGDWLAGRKATDASEPLRVLRLFCGYDDDPDADRDLWAEVYANPNAMGRARLLTGRTSGSPSIKQNCSVETLPQRSGMHIEGRICELTDRSPAGMVRVTEVLLTRTEGPAIRIVFREKAPYPVLTSSDARKAAIADVLDGLGL